MRLRGQVSGSVYLRQAMQAMEATTFTVTANAIEQASEGDPCDAANATSGNLRGAGS